MGVVVGRWVGGRFGVIAVAGGAVVGGAVVGGADIAGSAVFAGLLRVRG